MWMITRDFLPGIRSFLEIAELPSTLPDFIRCSGDSYGDTLS